MKAGREMDALVAEKVMGWKRVDVPKDYDGLNAGAVLLPTASTSIEWAPKGAYALWHFCPLYSTDISAAWQVVEKLKERQRIAQDGDASDPIWVRFVWNLQMSKHGVHAMLFNLTPETICKAALKAVGVEVPND